MGETKKEGVKQTFVDTAVNSVGIQQIPSNHQPCPSLYLGHRDKETEVQLPNCVTFNAQLQGIATREMILWSLIDL